jgi:flagellar biosynthesis anti-sigma factor FlgM
MNINKIPQYSTDVVQGLNATTSKQNREDNAGLVKDTGASSDRVDLSKDYQEMVQIKNVMMSRDEARTAKVELIRSQLANGTYQIKPEEIAKKMLDEMI